MYLHEFQAKNILKNNNIAVPKSFLLNDITNCEDVLNFFSKSDKLVCKAQVHSGARGKYGGIVFSDNNYNSLYKSVKNLLGRVLVTNQTGKDGKVINDILIEEFIDVDHEFYMSFFVDKEKESIVLLVSLAGGVGIEDNNKENLIKIDIDQLCGLLDYQVRLIVFFLKLDDLHFTNFKNILAKFLFIFLTCDLLLLEINPFVLSNGNFFCLDAKFEVDDNALYRQFDLKKSYDTRQENFIELEAKKYNLSYVSLDGNIGCVVNGAGLAMATMDMINLNGGFPSNFLDIGGDFSDEKAFHAFRIILLNTRVECIFVNIFGGIVRCDLIASSLIFAVRELNITIPIVVRLVGNMSNKALDIIRSSNLDIKIESNFVFAVRAVVNLSKE